MSVVSHANWCVTPAQARRLSVSSSKNSGDDTPPRLLLDASLEFVPCEEESLVTAFAAANDAEEAEALSKIVTGSCVDAVDEDLTTQSYKRGSAWWHADEESWIPIVVNKFLYHPEMSAEDVKAAFKASSTSKIIRHICTSCSPSHRDVYYKRLTAVPDSLDLLNVLKDSFSSVDIMYLALTLLSHRRIRMGAQHLGHIANIVMLMDSHTSVDLTEQLRNKPSIAPSHPLLPIHYYLLCLKKTTCSVSLLTLFHLLLVPSHPLLGAPSHCSI